MSDPTETREPENAPAAGEETLAADGSPRLLARDEWRILGLTLLGVLAFPYLLASAPVLSDLLNGYASLATLILVWGIFVMGYDLLHGYTGLLSFGHAAFWGAGGMTAGLLVEYVGVGYPLALVFAGIVVSVLLAWLIGYLSLRRGGIYFAILTLAFGQMIFFTVFGPLGTITGGEDGLLLDIPDLLGVIPLDAGVPVLTPLGIIPSWLYVVVSVFTLLSVAVAYRVLQSPYGLIFRAIRENEQRAEFVGLHVWRYKLVAFVLSGAFAGLAGALFTLYNGSASASSFYWIISGDVVIMSILGGVGTLFGGFVGAALYLYMSNVLITFVGDFWHLLLGVFFVAVVWLFPGGVWGGIDYVRARLRGDDAADGGDD